MSSRPKSDAQLAREAAARKAAEARRQAIHNAELANGTGGLVPGTFTTWEGLARMAQARAVAGQPVSLLDRDALRRHHRPRSGLDATTVRPSLDELGVELPPIVDPDDPDEYLPPPTIPRGEQRLGASAAFARAVAGSELAGRKWSPQEARLVDEAIRRVALALDEFTADDVWHELNGAVPVTKGLTARLVAAQRAGVIRSTDRVRRANRGGAHDHAQRLTVWEGLLS